MREVGSALNKGWRLCVTAADAYSTPPGGDGPNPWIEATLPGTAALALTQAGQSVPSLHELDVWYRAPLPWAGPATLRFEGLATIAEVFLGETLILRSQSMFEVHEVEVQIATGEELWICFRALSPRVAAKAVRARWRPRMIEPQGLRQIRTTLLGHMPGWCPKVDIVGPWRPIRLLSHDPPRAQDVRITAKWDGRAQLDVELTLAGAKAPPVLTCGGCSTTMERLGGDRYRGRLSPAAAQAWWPHTHGDARLYGVQVDVDGRSIHLGRTGFRTVEIDSGPDGQGFALRINGEPVFCRGACWINPDLLRLGGTRPDYEATLRLVHEAGFNMVRIAGVGVYETRAFFELCDELGLLVWQDFMFANFDYPVADPTFVAHARQEADDLLSDLQGCPSLAVLCGGSEVMQQAAMMGLPPLEWPLFEDVLREVAERLRPDTAYVPNTPIGGALPFTASAGVSHYYGVGAYRRPIEDARRAEVRFAAECLAFANVPQPESLAKAFTTPATDDPRWADRIPRDRGADWDFEDIRDHYLEQVFQVSPKALRGEDPQRYLDLSRAISGEVMGAVFAEWRRGRSTCGGALVWTLRDLEIGAGWGLIDATGEPKPAFYALKRIAQPLALAITDEGVNGLAIHLFNDRDELVISQLRLSIHAQDGLITETTIDVALSPRSNQDVSAHAMLGRFFDLSHAYRFGPRDHAAVSAQLLVGDRAEAEAIWFADPGAGLAEARVDARLEPSGAGWRLVLKSAALLRYVHIADEHYRALDDGFALLPGVAKTIELEARKAGATSPRGQIAVVGGGVVGDYGRSPASTQGS